MKFQIRKADFTPCGEDALVIGKYEDEPFPDRVSELGDAVKTVLGRLMDRGEITGAVAETVSLLAPHGSSIEQILVIGLGKRTDFDTRIAFQACAAAAKTLAMQSRSEVVFSLSEGWSEAEVENGVAGVFSGCQGQDLYRHSKRFHAFEKVIWITDGEDEAASRGAEIGKAIRLARKLVNEPASILTPMAFAECAEEVATANGLDIEIWDEAKLREERCEAFLAVSRGSIHDACLVRMTWRGPEGGSDSPDLSLVGKGVTFDTGGLSIKTKEGMIPMKIDMAGAATVLAAMQAIARMKVPLHVEAWMGMVENAIGDDAYRPGDILTARNGKTIEVHSTDAEGRLVLADTLSLAAERNPKHIIDLATLTGSCVTALGREAAGAMTNDEVWCAEVLAASHECGERLWQLPMFPEYDDLIEGEIGDLRNVGKNGGQAGSSVGAKFLERFVDDTSWVHIDMAGPAYLPKPVSWSDAGATGYFVRTLIRLARNQV